MLQDGAAAPQAEQAGQRRPSVRPFCAALGEEGLLLAKVCRVCHIHTAHQRRGCKPGNRNLWFSSWLEPARRLPLGRAFHPTLAPTEGTSSPR